MSTGRTIAAATVLSLFVASIGWIVLGGQHETAVAAAIPVVEEIPASEVTSLEWPDGLNHYLVTLDPAGLQAATTPATEGEETLRLDLEDTESGVSLSPDDIRELDEQLADALIEFGMGGGAPLPEGVTSDQVVAYFETLPEILAVEYLAGSMVTVATELGLDEIAAIPGVTNPVEDMLLPTTDWEPSDTDWLTEWHLDSEGQSWNYQRFGRDTDIDAPEAWDTSRGEGVVIAVVDIFGPSDLPELADNMWAPAGEICGNGIDDDGNGYVDDCGGWNFLTDAPLTDWTVHPGDQSHGVAVASSAASPADSGGVVGAAPEAQIMLLGAGQNNGISIAHAMRAVQYAADNGADIVNFSFGVPMAPGNPDAIDYYRGYYQGLFQPAVEADMVVTVAAGNSAAAYGPTNPVMPAYFAQDYPGAMAVSASDSTDHMAAFSNYGDWAHIAAPGRSVLVTYPDNATRSVSGTSFAAPITAGAAAVLRSAYPDASASAIVDALMVGADPIPAFSGLTRSGRLNVDRALDVLAGSEPVDFVFTDLSTGGGFVSVDAGTGDTVAFTLAVMIDEQIYSVNDVPVTWNGQTVVTDETGLATFSADLAAGVNSQLTFEGLESGAYGLVGQAMASGAPLDEPVLSVFTIDSSAPVPTTSTTVASSTTTSAGEDGGAATTTTLAEGVTTTTGAGESTTTTVGSGEPTTTTTVAATTTTSGGSPPTTAPVVTTTTAVANPTTTLSSNTTTTVVTTTTKPPVATTTTTASATTTTMAATTTTVVVSPTTTTFPTTTTTLRAATTTLAATTTTTEAKDAKTPPVREIIPSPSGFMVTKASPRATHAPGGTLVLKGTDFPQYPVIYTGEYRATIVERINDSTIVIEVPDGPSGWVEVAVHPIAQPDDVARLINAFKAIDRSENTNPVPDVTTTTLGEGSGDGGAGDGGSGDGPDSSSPTTTPDGENPGDATTTTWAGDDGDTTSTTAGDGDGFDPDVTSTTQVGVTSTTLPGAPTTVPATTSTTPAPPGGVYGPPDMSWNVAPEGMRTGRMGALGSLIGMDEWNEAYSPGGSSTGVRLGA